MQDLITVSIAAYRRPSLILQCLHSCIAQDYRPLEIDIGDDSPSGDTEEVARAVPLPEGITLRYWRNVPALKQAANVNKLFAEARGRRLVLMHDDDAMLPGAITALARAYDAGAPGTVAAYGIQQVIRENGELSPQDTDNHNRHANRLPAFTGLQDKLLVCALWRQFPNNGYLVETAAARAVGYRSFEEIGNPCDADFGIRLALHAKGRSFAFIDQDTSLYRLSAGGLRNAGDVSWQLFDYLKNELSGLEGEEAVARDGLMAKISQEAMMENALGNRRKAALRIFSSKFYPRRENILKSAYHLSLIAVPQIMRLRRTLGS